MNERYFNNTFRPWLYDLVSNNMAADNDHPESPYYFSVNMLSREDLREFLVHIIEYHDLDVIENICDKEVAQSFLIALKDNSFTGYFQKKSVYDLLYKMEEVGVENYAKYMQELIDEILPSVVQDRLKDNGLQYEGYDEL